MFTVVLYYKYIHIEDPVTLMREQKELCTKLGLTGRILVAEEGINGTLEGTDQAIAEFCKIFQSDERFADITIKFSQGIGDAFTKLDIRVRKEIVASYLPDSVSPLAKTGIHLEAEELHQWFEDGKEFYIVDMRNDYETRAGHFENSILSQIGNFRFLPQVLEKISHLKNKTIVTVCTGGVRCEKASAFLLDKGFTNVYQLKDGIVTYMEKYPNQHYKGKLYVFDKRYLIGFNTNAPEHEIIGRCYLCGTTSECYINCADPDCHLHFICCQNCRVGGKAFCSEKCKEVMRTM